MCTAQLPAPVRIPFGITGQCPLFDVQLLAGLASAADQWSHIPVLLSDMYALPFTANE